jgi:hypothetical protein
MGDFLYSDHKGPNLDHPDSAIRLACVVHRFRVPHIARKVSFAKSFKTVGQHAKMRKLVLNADDARGRLEDALDAKKVSSERVTADAARYLPMIGQILLSCKVQPEMARLDEKLVFEWQRGIEFKPETFREGVARLETIVWSLGRAGSGPKTLSREFQRSESRLRRCCRHLSESSGRSSPQVAVQGNESERQKLAFRMSRSNGKGVKRTVHGERTTNGNRYGTDATWKTKLFSRRQA